MTKKRNAFLRLLCAGVAVCLLISCTACGGSVDAAKNEYASGDGKEIFAQNNEPLLHYSDAAKLERLGLSSGLIELYIDVVSFGVAVRETAGDKYWFALPEYNAQTDSQKDNDAAAVSLVVRSGADTYYLNSQDNSVAYGNASYTFDGDSLTVTYIITPDAPTAAKTTYDAADLAFSVYIRYELTDGNLYVYSGWENLSGNTEAKLIWLGVLESFGASRDETAVEGDFMLVPDGCGAVINTAVKDWSFEPLRLAVYGSDPSTDFGKGAHPAHVGAYGVRQGGGAMAVILGSGAACAEICAARATESKAFNTVGARFNITPEKTVESGGKLTRYIAANSRDTEVSMCMRFLSGRNAEYAGIASVCREQLIRENILTTKTVEREDYLPFSLSLLGAVEGSIFETGDFRGIETLTTFEQAQDLLIRMRSKGINNINLRYTGALTGGIDQSIAASASFLRILGGESEFKELVQYVVSQKMAIFIDVDVISGKSGKIGSSMSAAHNILGSKQTFETPNVLKNYIGGETFTRNLQKLSTLKSGILEVLINTWKINFTGYCIDDAGSLLFTDFSEAIYTDREFVAQTVMDETAALSGGREMMISGGNFYMLKDADMVVDIPMETAVPESTCYEAVPFIQLILHGSLDYSGRAINTFDSENIKREMLHSIEFGACPSYEWCYEYGSLAARDLDATNFWYEDWINGAMTFYNSANEALGDIRASRMTGHQKIADGIYCTEYDDSIKVYVNYTDKDYTVTGVTVPANDFLRID